MVGSMKSLTLEPAEEERSQIVRQSPSFLGTTPSPEQQILGKGGVS